MGWESVKLTRSKTFSYIESYYNLVRRHSVLGYTSPEEFKREINLKKKGSSSGSIHSRRRIPTAANANAGCAA